MGEEQNPFKKMAEKHKSKKEEKLKLHVKRKKN